MFSEEPQVFDKAAGTVAVDTAAGMAVGMAVGMFAGTAADTGTAGIVAADTAAGIDPAWCRSAESVVPGMTVRAARKMLDFLRKRSSAVWAEFNRRVCYLCSTVSAKHD